MARNNPYQYQPGDSPLTVAQQFNLQPSQLISANPGGYPFQTGQTINIPRLTTPTNAPNPYAPAVAANNIVGNQATMPPRGVPRQYQKYVNAVTPQGTGGASANVSMGQLGNVPSYSQLAGNNPWTNPGAYQTTNFGFSPTAGYQNIMQRLAQDPTQINNLPPSSREAIERMIEGTSGAKTDAQGNTYTADPSQSAGGRFIQVGEVRWERNKNGRLVKVQYTGGGSWRNKRIVQGARGQAKARLAAQQPQAAVEPGNSNIPGFGLVNFSVGAG